MTTPRIRPLRLPDDWSPAQASAALELLDLLRDHLWSLYGSRIQDHPREDRLQHDPRQLHIPIEGPPL
jgi:hypothetical protein